MLMGIMQSRKYLIFFLISGIIISGITLYLNYVDNLWIAILSDNKNNNPYTVNIEPIQKRKIKMEHKKVYEKIQENNVIKEIINPLTGEIIEQTYDDLAENIHMVNEYIKHLSYFVRQARVILAEMSPKAEDSYTSYARGEKYRIKIVYPANQWDNNSLQNAWNFYPEYRQYLRISKIEPNMREIKKLKKEIGDSNFQKFKEIVLAAERESNSPPVITIVEEIKHGQI